MEIVNHVSHPIETVCFAVVMLIWSAVNPSVAAEYTGGNILVTDPWARAMAPAAKVGVGYLGFIRNPGDASDRLVAIQSDVAGHIEIHEMRMENNVMKMRKLADELPIAAHVYRDLAARWLSCHVF